MMPYWILPAADNDLEIQAEYLARTAGLELALRFYDAAASTFEAIARMPGIGEPRNSTDPRLPNLRVLSLEGFDKHLVFYREYREGIEIVRVVHGAREPAKMPDGLD